MNLFFDELSQKLIMNAKLEMSELKHPYVGTEHLLLAILKDKDLNVTKELSKFDIDYNKFRNKLINVVGLGTKGNDWFLFTPLLKKVINNSEYYVNSSEKKITPLALLLSIFREGDGVANRILISMNINVDDVYDYLLDSKNIVSAPDYNFLDEIGVNMNDKSINDRYDPVIGRDNYIKQLMQVLLRKNKNNPLLIGDAGVGKTAIVEELSRLISLGQVPSKLKGKVIYNISVSSLVSGTKYRGEFEEKINKLISEVKKNKDLILFVDEIHTLMGAGGAEGAIDASNIIKPYLARGEIKLIGATTTVEYDKYLSKDKAFDRRFQKIYVEEPKEDEVRNILLNLKNIYEDFHNVIISKEIIELILHLSFGCIFNGKQPDKSIDLLDEVCSYVSLRFNKEEDKINDYEMKINDLEKEKNNKIMSHDFKNAILIKESEQKLRSEYDKYLLSTISNNRFKRISKSDVFKVVCNKNMVPDKTVFKKKLIRLKRDLKECLFGQCEVIDKVIEILKKYDYINNKQSLVLLLIGKSGVGKTFLTDKLIDSVFSSNYIKINMSEFSNSQSISKLIGSPPGYIGYNDECVLEKLKHKPYSLIVLDNFDTGNTEILRFFKKCIEDGYFYNSVGDKIVVAKCIFIIISRKKCFDIGFVSRESSIDSGFSNSYVINFNDVDLNSINKYINCNYKDYTFDKNEVMKKIDYVNNGFKNIDSILKKSLNFKIKS